MAKLTTSLYKKHATITNSIAFLPSIISAAFFMLALYMQYFEATPLSSYIEEKLPFANIHEEENARMILNTLAAGTISLTVFSFSMVMIVLSQASNNLSPRVIPGLTTARSHQIVLGFNIGTIIYVLLLLLNYQPENEDSKTPVIAILLGLVFGIICLVLFVYFIHTISKAIQVDNILNSLYLEAVKALDQEIEVVNKTHTTYETDKNAFLYYVKNKASGYLKQVNITELQQLAKEHDMQIEILIETGSFVVEGTPLLKLTQDATDKQGLEEKLQDCFDLSQEEVVMRDFEQGVKQISEIAVKALSPGINDPGTAIKAIDFMTLLFVRRMKSDDLNCLLNDDNRLVIIDRIVTLDELLLRYLSPIRTYGKSDFQIIVRLLKCLQSLLYQQPSPQKLEVIRRHTLAVISDGDKSIENIVDRERINNYISRINELLPEEHKLDTIETGSM